MTDSGMLEPTNGHITRSAKVGSCWQITSARWELACVGSLCKPPGESGTAGADQGVPCNAKASGDDTVHFVSK